MKKKGLQGSKLVFCFTLKQQLRQKGWLFATFLPAVLLLIGIPVVLMIAEEAQKKAPDHTEITKVMVLDKSDGIVDFSILNQMEDPVFYSLEYSTVNSREEALREAETCDTALIMQIEWNEAYELTLVKPENTALKKKDINAYSDFLIESFQSIAVQKAVLSPVLLMELSVPVSTNVSTSQAFREQEPDGGSEMVREVLEIALPYLGIMILYFMVLVYGQGIAGNVVSEKSSKLMDTLLLSVEPQGLILGKTLAGWLAGSLQLVVWVAGLVFGCIIGRSLVLHTNPDSSMGILQLFDLIGKTGELFTPINVIFGTLILLAGFLMYCAIASIGGALASRTEDLGNCNSVFTFLLLASFLLTMYGETDSSSSVVSSAGWMNYVPFTAVLCTPARAMLGQATPLCCVVSLVLILLVGLLAVLLAGKLYRLLTFHNGAPPKLRNLPALLKSR